MAESILTVLFNVESEGYQAYMELTKRLITDSYTVVQGALVKKVGNTVSIIEHFNNAVERTDDTLRGSLIGSFIGILGGPLGVLLGGATGTLIGGAVDENEFHETGSLLETVGNKLQPDEVAMIFLAQEEDESALNSYFSKFKTVVMRHDAAAVQEEVAEAERVQKELEEEAKRRMRQEKSDARKAKVEENRAKMKANFEGFKARFKKD